MTDVAPSTHLADPVVIVGAGPAGSLLSIYLARLGHRVTVYERRPDLRRTSVDAGRSINLALAFRGMVPLIEIGAIDEVDAITIPMKGRMVHPVDGSAAELQRYGNRPHEVIHSVSRTDLNAILLDAAEATGMVDLQFDRPVERVDLETSRVIFADGSTAPFGVVFGADGAGSPVRTALVEAGVCDATVTPLDCCYKELTLPAAADGSHQLDPHALHIWPRGDHMLIALANPGGDFTLTLFAPQSRFDRLGTPEAIDAYFNEHFSDVVAMIDGLADEFMSHPMGTLGTLWASGWHAGANALVLGDAAHAVVPFHGQGMNAAMESVRVLARHLKAEPTDIAKAFAAYERERKPDTDAIAQMAIDNYTEMSSGVVDPDYLARRQLALDLEQRHPEHLSPRYNMVMFSTMPYSEARSRAAQQAEIITAALADPTLDIDALVQALPPLPPLDPLIDPNALSVD